MVYSSDFYTTRRPYSTYSTSRPYVSSYNVTVRTIPHMPYVAHKKLVTIVHTPVHIYHSGTYLPIKLHSRVRPSIIAAELNRIRYLTRPSYNSFTENYLNSRDYIDFDDETREIRAKTDDLLRRIHTFVPRPVLSHYNEQSPERLRSDDYVRRIINAKNITKEIDGLPWYQTPAIRDIGTGNLACIKYAGGRPQARRRPYYTVSDVIPGDVKSDVNLMSFYLKNRKAAEDASPQIEHHSHDNKEDTVNAPPLIVSRTDEIHGNEAEIPKGSTKERAVAKDESEPTEAEAEPRPETTAQLSEDNENEDAEAEYDENGVKKQPDEDTIKKVQEYLEKKAAEKKMEEDRRAWEAAERRRIAEEKEIARLAKLKIEEDIRIAEIKEQERLEAERQAVIARAEAARLEAERLIEDEKLYNEAVAQAIADEQERAQREKDKEELERRRTEEEEKLSNLVLSVDAPGADGGVIILEHGGDEHSDHVDYTDQDQEAKPYEVDHDEDTEVEEDEQEENNEIESPFTNGEAAVSSSEADEAIADAPQIKESKRDCNHGEQGFDWSQYESEHEEETCEEAEEAIVEEETAENVEHQQTFEEAEAKSVGETDEAQIEELQMTEEEEDETEHELEEAAEEQKQVEETKSEEKTDDESSEEESDEDDDDDDDEESTEVDENEDDE